MSSQSSSLSPSRVVHHPSHVAVDMIRSSTSADDKLDDHQSSSSSSSSPHTPAEVECLMALSSLALRDTHITKRRADDKNGEQYDSDKEGGRGGRESGAQHERATNVAMISIDASSATASIASPQSSSSSPHRATIQPGEELSLPTSKSSSSPSASAMKTSAYSFTPGSMMVAPSAPISSSSSSSKTAAAITAHADSASAIATPIGVKADEAQHQQQSMPSIRMQSLSSVSSSDDPTPLSIDYMPARQQQQYMMQQSSSPSHHHQQQQQQQLSPMSYHRRPAQLEMKDYSDQNMNQQHQQRLSSTPTNRSRRSSHGEGHQVRVCMYTMPQNCVLPLELRMYSSMYITPAGYPYYDPRQLQGGGVTSNYRTKPNPLLQYQSPGPTFPPHPSMRHSGNVSPYQQQQMKSTASPEYYMQQLQMQQQSQPMMMTSQSMQQQQQHNQQQQSQPMHQQQQQHNPYQQSTPPPQQQQYSSMQHQQPGWPYDNQQQQQPLMSNQPMSNQPMMNQAMMNQPINSRVADSSRRAAQAVIHYQRRQRKSFDLQVNEPGQSMGGGSSNISNINMPSSSSSTSRQPSQGYGMNEVDPQHLMPFSPIIPTATLSLLSTPIAVAASSSSSSLPMLPVPMMMTPMITLSLPNSSSLAPTPSSSTAAMSAPVVSSITADESAAQMEPGGIKIMSDAQRVGCKADNASTPILPSSSSSNVASKSTPRDKLNL